MIETTERVRCILDQLDSVAVRDREQLVERGGMAGEVDRSDGSRARADRRLDLRRIDTERPWIDVDEAGARAERDDHVCSRAERERRGHDFVARADADRGIGAMQRRRSARDDDRVLCAPGFRQLALEELHFRTRREMIGTKDADDGGDVVIVDELAPVRKRQAVGHWSSSPEGPRRSTISLSSSRVSHRSLLSEP